MCYKHWLLIMGWSKLPPASQLVPAFYYHALNCIPGQIATVCMALHTVTVCMACFHRSQQESLPWSMLSVGFILTRRHPTTYCTLRGEWLYGLQFLGDWLKGPLQLWEKFYKRQSCPHYQLHCCLLGDFKVWPGHQLEPQFPHYFPKYWFSPSTAICRCKRGKYVL